MLFAALLNQATDTKLLPLMLWKSERIGFSALSFGNDSESQFYARSADRQGIYALAGQPP